MKHYDLLKVEEWCRHNNMVLNPSKTTCMLIGSKHKLKNCASLNLNIRQEKGSICYFSKTLRRTY